MDAFLKAMVRGHKWKCRMFNGAIFEWWTPTNVGRKAARAELYAEANAMCSEDDPAYVKGDIESMWKVKQ